MERIELNTVLYNVNGGFTRSQIIARLSEFRQECGEMFLQDAPIAVVVRDITDFLGLDENETATILGPEVYQAIRQWECAREWALTEKGKAAILNGVAALAGPG